MDSETAFTMPVVPQGSGYGNSGDMFGGNGAWWIIILFLFVFCGWGNNGFGGNGAQTGAGVMDGYVLTSDFATIERKLDTVNSGLCDGFYAVAQQFATLQNGINQGFAGLNTVTLQGFSGLNTTALQGFNAVDKSIAAVQSQLASCCCDVERQVEAVRYDAALQSNETRNLVQSTACGLQNTMNTNTRDIVDTQRDGVNAILGKLSQMEYNGLNDKYQAAMAENQALRFTASQQAQNAYLVSTLRPTPIPAYQSCNPWAASAPYGACTAYGA